MGLDPHLLVHIPFDQYARGPCVRGGRVLAVFVRFLIYNYV
jgi:hypothetical protein